MSDISCLHAARAVLRVAGLLGVPTGVRDFASLDLETAPSSETLYGTRKKERTWQKNLPVKKQHSWKTGLLLFDMCTLPLGQISPAFI